MCEDLGKFPHEFGDCTTDELAYLRVVRGWGMTPEEDRDRFLDAMVEEQMARSKLEAIRRGR